MNYWMSLTTSELYEWMGAINDERKERLERMKSARRR